MGRGFNRLVEPLLEAPKLLLGIRSLGEPDHARQVIVAEFLLEGLAFIRAELGQAEVIKQSECMVLISQRAADKSHCALKVLCVVNRRPARADEVVVNDAQ